MTKILEQTERLQMFQTRILKKLKIFPRMVRILTNNFRQEQKNNNMYETSYLSSVPVNTGFWSCTSLICRKQWNIQWMEQLLLHTFKKVNNIMPLKIILSLVYHPVLFKSWCRQAAVYIYFSKLFFTNKYNTLCIYV